MAVLLCNGQARELLRTWFVHVCTSEMQTSCVSVNFLNLLRVSIFVWAHWWTMCYLPLNLCLDGIYQHCGIPAGALQLVNKSMPVMEGSEFPLQGVLLVTYIAVTSPVTQSIFCTFPLQIILVLSDCVGERMGPMPAQMRQPLQSLLG